MSVISESQESEAVIVIEAFTCCEDGLEFNWKDAKDFVIGEEVYYLDGYKNPDSPFSQDHLSWLIKFKTKDGKIFSASQLYFATKESWENIDSFFKEKYGLK